MLPNEFMITEKGVNSKKRKIIQFSISQFKSDSFNDNDIRPKNHEELMRYCCKVKSSQSRIKNVLFKDTTNYFWEFCKLDTSMVSNSALSMQQKIDLIKIREHKNINLHNYKIPFQIEKGFVYQIFGLPDFEGSYYFCIDNFNKLKVQCQDQGSF
jgi:hypothetical protein